MVTPRGRSDPPKESGGIAILREGGAAEFLRRRIERPSRIGFYGLLFFGVLTAFFGLLTAGIGGSLGSIGRSPLSAGIIVLGGVLILLGWGQHLLYRRDLAHWPDQAILWDQGIEPGVVRVEGEVAREELDAGEVLLLLPERDRRRHGFLTARRVDGDDGT